MELTNWDVLSVLELKKKQNKQKKRIRGLLFKKYPVRYYSKILFEGPKCLTWRLGDSSKD